jgi:hypothetical protein
VILAPISCARFEISFVAESNSESEAMSRRSPALKPAQVESIVDAPALEEFKLNFTGTLRNHDLRICKANRLLIIVFHRNALKMPSSLRSGIWDGYAYAEGCRLAVRGYRS